MTKKTSKEDSLKVQTYEKFKKDIDGYDPDILNRWLDYYYLGLKKRISEKEYILLKDAVENKDIYYIFCLLEEYITLHIIWDNSWDSYLEETLGMLGFMKKEFLNAPILAQILLILSMMVIIFAITLGISMAIDGFQQFLYQ